MPLTTCLSINGLETERVSSFPFLGTTIHESLSRNLNTCLRQRKAQSDPPPSGNCDSLLQISHRECAHFVFLVWYDNTTTEDRTRLDRVTRRASEIIGFSLPVLASLYSAGIVRNAKKITAGPPHPAHHLVNLFPSGRQYRSIRCRTSHLRDSPNPYKGKLGA